MNAKPPDNSALADDKTVVAPRTPGQVRVCPVCGTANALEPLLKREYRCGKCNLELAHVDYAPNGSIRGVFGWLLAPGDVALDRYQIKSVLGKGGFGAAYLVDDLQLSGKRRALKEVPEMLFDEYETALLSRLDHPAIPDIIERRAANGMVYLSLKFGGSRTLGSERKQYPDRRVPMEKLFPWMRQLCEVLIYLHSQTPPIIHRDLKPDNILLNEDERIMLVDFGIAKESVPEAMTRTLGRAATYGFSPPEQVMGTGTDERSDIYALGATFYALLTGQNPPPAHERVAGAELALPSQSVPDVPPEVEDAIIQSLSLNMNQRQRTVREFALALGVAEPGTASRPVGPAAGPSGAVTTRSRLATAARGTDPAPRSQRTLALTLAGIAVALAALAGGAYVYLSKPDRRVESQHPMAIGATPAATPPAAPAVPPVPAAPVATPAATASPPEPPATDAASQAPEPPRLPPPVQPVVETPPTPAAGGGSGPAPTTPQASEPGQQPMAKPKEPAAVSAPQPSEPKPVAKAHPAVPVERAVPRPLVNRPLVRRAAPAERASPKPSGGTSPSWTIIPGGAHKTD